jgi:hypothetical protein
MLGGLGALQQKSLGEEEKPLCLFFAFSEEA